MISVPNDYKEPVSLQSSLSDFSQITNPFTAIKNSLHGSKADLNDEMENQEASSCAPSPVIHDSKAPQKKNSAPDSSKSPKRKHKNWTDPAIANWNVLPPTLKSSLKPDLHRDDSLTSQLSTEKLQLKPQLILLYMVSTPCKLHINPNRYRDHYISYASKQSAPYKYVQAIIQKVFTLRMTFPRPSVFGLHPCDSNL